MSLKVLAVWHLSKLHNIYILQIISLKRYIFSQGQEWADIRNKVNPVLMKVQNVRQNLPQLDQISKEFIDK